MEETHFRVIPVNLGHSVNRWDAQLLNLLNGFLLEGGGYEVTGGGGGVWLYSERKVVLVLAYLFCIEITLLLFIAAGAINVLMWIFGDCGCT